MDNKLWNSAKEIRTGQTQKQPELRLGGKVGLGRFNKTFIFKYGLEKKKFVKILFVKQENKVIIGFRFLEQKEVNTLKLGYKKSGAAIFSTRSLFSQMGLEFKKFQLTSYTPVVQEYKNDKIFVVEIAFKK